MASKSHRTQRPRMSARSRPRVLANLETHCLALVLEPGLEILDPAALGQPIRDHLRNDYHYQARGGNNCCGGCNPRCPPNHDRPFPRSARSVSLPPTSMNCHEKMPPSRPRIRVASRRPAMLHQKNDTGLANLCALISCCTRRCRRCEADLVTRAVATLQWSPGSMRSANCTDGGSSCHASRERGGGLPASLAPA
jgi:hypothetical protein